MKRLVLLSILLLLPEFSYAQAEPEPGYELRVLAMDDLGVTLELHVTGFASSTQTHEGTTYQTTIVPGLVPMTLPGQPQLPGLSRLLGTPPGGVTDITVLDSECETLHPVRLLPTRSPSNASPAGAPDKALYLRDALFPAALAEVGLTGKLRDQPVAQVRLHPFRYNPVRQQLQVCRRVMVRVDFAQTLGALPRTPLDQRATPYERMLQRSLLNYAALPPTAPPERTVSVSEVSDLTTTPRLKIFVDADGIYEITRAELQDAGFDLTGLDPRRLRLTNGGSEVAIHISGEADGSFDPDDRLEFFGQAVGSEFTNRNVYWLTASDGPGLRMAERDGAPTGAGTTPTAFLTALEREENHVYWQVLPNGAGKDHWFWERFPSAPYSSSYAFQLDNIATNPSDATITVRLHGRTSTDVDPDHHTRIRLNGTLIDEAWWDGQTPFTHTITVSQQLLRNGTNWLKVRTPGDTGATVDSLYVDGFDVDYWDSYVAENDQLEFSAPETGKFEFSIRSFSTPNIQVYDVSDPTHVSHLVNGIIDAQGGAYRVRFEDDAVPDTRYVALAANQKRTPVGLQIDSPSNWRSSDNAADYVIITHEDFKDAAARLADHRSQQGLRVATVLVTDTYDEFSYGVFDPQAIRAFLSYAYHNWTPPAPQYVVLIGDANYDYHDYLDTGAPNYVPTHLFESPLIGQTPTDNWFASVSGADPLPDMSIGRLSVRTLPQAHATVDKILAYEQNPSPAAWQKSALFVAGVEASFETISDDLIGRLPANYTPQRVYASLYPQPYDPTDDIIQAIDAGALIVNYVGHGSTTTWGYWNGQQIFRMNDIPRLDNQPRYPFLVTGNCNNGLFAHPEIPDSFAERFVGIENRGGIGAWSPTGLGYAFWHDGMTRALYQALFSDYLYQMGPATTAAKIEGFAQLGWTEPVEIFTLFGDPALALQVVQPRLNLDKRATASHTAPGGRLTYVLSYANVGNFPATNVVLTEHFDPNTLFEAASPPPTSGNNTWAIGTLPAGSSGTVTVTVRVQRAIPDDTTLLNQAVLTGDGLPVKTAEAHTPVAHLHTYFPLIFQE